MTLSTVPNNYQLGATGAELTEPNNSYTYVSSVAAATQEELRGRASAVGWPQRRHIRDECARDDDVDRLGSRRCLAVETWGRMEAMSVGEDLLEQRRRRRRAGDPRLSDADREILRRITSGDLAPAFQAALDADVVGDPVLGGHDLD